MPQRTRVDMAQRKRCVQCNAEFAPTPGRGHRLWARQQFCSGRCANTWRARQQTKAPSTMRRQGEQWARWWERQRRAEDRADLKTWKPKVYPHCRLSQQPQPRQWIAGTCPGCHQPVVVIRGWWHDSIYCPPCTKAKWRMNDRKRAAHYGVEHENIDRFAVFAEDNYVCQICKRKAKRKYPHPRSPTIDHIIPLSKGGPNLRHNVQTACLECNVRKHNGAANDQLRLALAG